LASSSINNAVNGGIGTTTQGAFQVANGPLGQQNINNYLRTNFLTNSLDDGTLYMQNQIMMPTHKYNRRTLLMMQNLHNNYLYSANSGILFTMQRGWNSGHGPPGGATVT
jgi:hypothetical protein